jgi:hypothetical protein
MPAPIDIHSPRLHRPQSSISTPLLQQSSNLTTAYEYVYSYEGLCK